jgi:Fe-S-cluster-containing hydrogenase component 2
MLLINGVPTEEELDKIFPSQERLLQGPIAIFECYQNIPCDPCFKACKIGAIKPFEDINDLPKLLEEKCVGCGLCISKCPGLSICIIDYTYSHTQALMKLPYEFLPLPKVHESVMALDRQGQDVCMAKVVEVMNHESFDKTPVVSIIFDKTYIKAVRNFRLIGGQDG